MLRFLFGLIFSIVGIPILLLFLLLDYSPEIPIEVYEDANVKAIVQDELNSALEDIKTGKVNISIKQDNLNKIIYNYIKLEVNPNYAPGDDCDDIECKYIDYETDVVNDQEYFLGVTGMWVEFFEDIISLHVTVSGNYYVDIDTSLNIQLKVLDNDDSYTVEFHKVKVGKVGLPKGIVRPIVNKIIDAANVDPTEWNNDFMTVEMEKLRVYVDKQELVKYISDNEQIEAGLNLVMDNQLVKLDVFEEDPRIEVYLDVDKITAESQLPEYLVNFNPTIFDVKTEIEKELNMIMVGALSGDPKINITEELLNKLLAETVSSMMLNEIIPVGEVELDISIDGSWVEFLEEELELNFQLNINGVKILIELNNSVVNENGDLVFTLNGAYIGRDPGESEDDYVVITKENILLLLEDFTLENDLVEFDMINGQMIIRKDSISNLINTGSTGITIGDINLIDGMISVGINLPQQELLDAVVEEVEGVIDNLEEGIDFIDESIPEEVAFEEKVSEIASSIDLTAGEVNITPEDVQELTELYYDMPEETQEEFIEYVQDNIDPQIIADFLESFMQ